MGTHKKLPGQVVDKRNGQIAILKPMNEHADVEVMHEHAEVETKKHPNYFPAPEGLCDLAYHAWEAYFHSPVVRLYDSVDATALLRWIRHVDRYERLMQQADAAPLNYDAQYRAKVNPLYDLAFKVESKISELENKLGIGPKARSAIGVAFAQAGKSLAEMNASLNDREEDGVTNDDFDPRIPIIRGETA